MHVNVLYQEILEEIYARLPMFTRIGAAAYKPDLGNIVALCEALGNPQKKFKSIHIAGTNGKGSCSHMLAAILQEAGYKTGLYTSPHIQDFRERIRIQGEMMAKEDIVHFYTSNKSLIDQIQPSFFEVTVALAFYYFAKEQVDVAVVEVGLGGLLDSTNILIPEVSVITNISLDHMQFLGDTLPLIAEQKAGIIKEGIPVVIGETLPETERIFFARSIKQKAPIFFSERHWSVISTHAEAGKQKIRMLDLGQQQLLDIEMDLTGAYQALNLRTVCTTIQVLNQLGWKISSDRMQQALRSVKIRTGLLGRFDQIRSQPTVILDVSHNEAGIVWAIRQFENFDAQRKLVLLGMVADKDIDKILKLFPAHWEYVFTQAQIPRALPYTQLQEQAARYQLKGMAIPTVTQALREIYSKMHEHDALLVTGSFFTLEEAYSFFHSN
ncbi:MAG: bifunctional folylpolyglutamate synthase/dihydrofolate synthase [Chitinophagaceae bacterium]|nr:bifunctional folylpolyglutamate synthase/dihydrofolate synthase [Chitinophagaceae bacterium]